MALGDLGDLAVNDLDIGAGGNLSLDELGECNTVDRQGATSGNSRAMGAESGRVDLNELEQTSSAR